MSIVHEAPACARCTYYVDDRALLEARIPGLASFGSAFGASVGADRLCVRHDRLVSPRDRCAAFVMLRAKEDAESERTPD